MQEVLVDSRQLSLQNFTKHRNYLRIAFHHNLRSTRLNTLRTAECTPAGRPRETCEGGTRLALVRGVRLRRFWRGGDRERLWWRRRPALFGRINDGVAGFFKQAVVHAVECEFEAVGDAEFVVNLTQVVLDDLLGSADFLGDVLVLHALGYAGNDLELFLAEARLVARSHKLGSLGAISLDDPVHAAIIEPCFAGMHFADAAN